MAPWAAQLVLACAVVATSAHDKDPLLCDDHATLARGSVSGLHLLQAGAAHRSRRRNEILVSPFDEYITIAPAAVVAGMAGQQTCSLKMLCGRDDKAYNVAFKNYLGAAAALSVEEDQSVATGDYRGASVSYSYTGPHFGCMRVEGLHSSTATTAAMDKASAAIGQMVGSSAATWPAGVYPAIDVAQAVLDFVNTNIDDPSAYAILVQYKGVLVEKYKDGHTRDSRFHGWSIAKSILSMLLGVRSSEGKLDISSYAHAPEISHDEKMHRNMTIENVLAMRVASPLEDMLGTPWMLWQANNTAAYAVAGKPRAQVQAGDWYYSSGNSNTNSRELRYSFGDDAAGLEAYLQYPWEALFSRIGASSFACEVDPSMTFIFSSFCYATARDFMKLAQLVLQKGAWGEKQVVPAEWMEWSTRGDLGVKGSGYARGWWNLDRRYREAKLGTPVISACGVMGQYSMAIPEHDLLITRLGSNDGKSLQWFQDPAVGQNSLFQLLQSLPK